MTTYRIGAIFVTATSSTQNAPSGRNIALVTVTVTAGAISLSFTPARCPVCQTLLMAIPGSVVVEVRGIQSNSDRSGRGRVIACRKTKRCPRLCEIIEHTREL